MPTHKTTTTTEAVLAALARGPASAAEVARSAGIGRSTATKALASLAAEGKVERRPGGHDGARRLADRWSLPSAKHRPVREPSEGGGPPARLGRGELADLVLAYLRASPGEHSPGAVAKALEGRSSGAVGNALARLVGAGHALRTNEAPRRYRAAGR
jgi:DNA-binding transcriptional ArsR family regulator